MQKEFHDSCSASVKVRFQIEDRSVAVFPNRLLVHQLFGKALAAQDFRMDTDDEHLFVIRTVEDTDSAALGKTHGRAPEEVVIQFGGARMFKAEDLAALRIDSGHN